MAITTNRSVQLLAAIFLSALLNACGSSDKVTAKDGGIVAGLVEQVLHHGAYNPDGPNETVTSMRDLTLQITDNEGRTVATPTTDREGKFHVVLPPGSYIVLPPEMERADTPTSAPSPERIKIQQGDSLFLSFQYSIFAP